MVEHYEFSEVAQCKATADKIYENLRDAKYKLSTQIQNGNEAHQIYRVFAPEATSDRAARMLMSFEYNGTAQPPSLRVNCASLKHGGKFRTLVDEAVGDFQGKSVQDRSSVIDIG